MSDCDIYLKEEEGLTVREKQSRRGFILNDLMAMSLDKKIELSRAIICESLSHTGDREQIVACSFGKDSIVLLDLVRQFEPNVKVVFNNTGVEFPETLKFKDEIVKPWDLDYSELYASDFTFKDRDGNEQKSTFWNIVREYGFPGTSTESRAKKKHKCCYYLKEKPMFQFIRNKSVTLYIGFVGDEGQYRRWLFIQKGDFNYYSKIWWIKSDLPQRILDDAQTGRNLGHELRDELSKKAPGMGMKCSSLLLIKCGYDNVVPVDIWVIRFLRSRGYNIPEPDYRRISGLVKREYLKYEEIFSEIGRKEYGISSVAFQAAIWAKNSYWNRSGIPPEQVALGGAA